MSARVAPARRRGLADEVADRLRDAIFDGAYAPGSSLREVELAEVLGVSRGPVREALLKLEREGLVRGEWHRGTTVTSLSEVDIAELDSLRAALERLAVELVIDRAADLTEVDAVVTRMERAAGEHEMVRCDLDFHDAVYRGRGAPASRGGLAGDPLAGPPVPADPHRRRDRRLPDRHPRRTPAARRRIAGGRPRSGP